VYRIPKIDRGTEAALFARFHDDDDLDAARALVMAHLRYVVYEAKRFAGYGLPLEDLIQQGNIGLMHSVKRFEPHRGLRLLTFAVHWIRAEITDFILKNWRLVKVATTKVQKKLFFNLRKMTTSLDQLSEQTIQDVAEELQVPTADVREMALRMRGIDASFDAISDEDFSAPERSLVLEGADPAEVVETLDAHVHESALLASAFAVLDARSQEIIQRRWMSDAKASLAELAEDFGVSIERVRQIEQAALRKLRSLVATD
jgi:RNA polymerase sigma-32 factor